MEASLRAKPPKEIGKVACTQDVSFKEEWMMVSKELRKPISNSLQDSVTAFRRTVLSK